MPERLSDHSLSLASGEEEDRHYSPSLPEVPNLGDGQVLEVVSSKTGTVLEIRENKIAIAAVIIPFSIAGVLIRIALQRLESYDGAPVFPLIYAQWVGCFIMGIVVQNKANLIEWYLPIHIGLSTGLCGSITTFSSWSLGIFEGFSNYSGASHTLGKNVLAGLSEFIVTLAMSLNALVFGYHLGMIIDRRLKKDLPPHTVKIIPYNHSIRHLSRTDMVAILFGTFSWIGVIFAAIFAQDQRELALACVFAPVGALTRWYLSYFNTYNNGQFPLGTFIANMSGTMILAVLTLLTSGISISPVACDVVLALGDGLCGCLTTVSTFVVELSTLPFQASYLYGISSVITGQIFMFVILGSYIWTNGVHPMCSS